MSNTNKNYEQDLEQIREEAQGARQEWIAALEAAKASKKERQKKIDDAIEEHKARLDELATKKDKARDDLAEALMTGDTDEAESIRGEIATIEEEARDVQASIATLCSYNSAKAEAEAVLEAVEKYRAASETAVRLSAEIGVVLAEVREKREYLERLEQKIEVARRTISTRAHSGAASADERDLIALYEESLGKIDVTGHHAGSDETAMLRFLRGSTRGIEDIPALKAGTEDDEEATAKKQLGENLGSSDEA